MKSIIQTLQDEITQNTLGVFWITEDPLCKDTPLLKEFDYFTNGQISIFLKARSADSPKYSRNIFVQKNFGEDNFICHIQDLPSERNDSLTQLKSLLYAVKSKCNELIVINKSSHNYGKELEKLYPEVKIKVLEI